MAKPPKKESALVNGAQRCEVCGTQLTLYPKSFVPCPRCQKRVCRRCWGAAWAAKNFSNEQCSHLLENDGQTLNSVEGGKRFEWDWHRILFAGALAVLIALLLYFLLNLFVL